MVMLYAEQSILVLNNKFKVDYVFEMYSNMDIDSMSIVQFVMNLDLSCKKKRVSSPKTHLNLK